MVAALWLMRRTLGTRREKRSERDDARERPTKEDGICFGGEDTGGRMIGMKYICAKKIVCPDFMWPIPLLPHTSRKGFSCKKLTGHCTNRVSRVKNHGNKLLGMFGFITHHVVDRDSSRAPR